MKTERFSKKSHVHLFIESVPHWSYTSFFCFLLENNNVFYGITSAFSNNNKSIVSVSGDHSLKKKFATVLIRAHVFIL